MILTDSPSLEDELAALVTGVHDGAEVGGLLGVADDGAADLVEELVGVHQGLAVVAEGLEEVVGKHGMPIAPAVHHGLDAAGGDGLA